MQRGCFPVIPIRKQHAISTETAAGMIVASIIMKIQKDAGERQKLIKEYQFVDAKEECNISLEDYYIRYC